MICPHCHADNREGAKFCDECGTRLASAPAAGEGGSEHAEDPEKVRRSGASSGPLDGLPVIAVAGLNADAQGHRVTEESFELDEAELAAEDAPSAADDGAADPAARAGEDAPSYDAALAEDASRSDEASADEVAADAPGTEPPDVPAASKTAAIPAGETGVIAARANAPASEASQTRRIDLSGFDEYLPAGSYVPPSPSWRDGGTMKMPRIEEPGSVDQKSFIAPEEGKKRGRALKVGLGIAAALVLIAAIAAFATYSMELWGGKVVPDVVGMTQADATNTLESKGFTVRATQVKSDETEGLVLLMDPSGGGRANEGAEVVIHIATARCVPDIVGSARADAEAAIEAEGLDNVTFTTQKSDEAEGTVLSVEPAEGEKVKAGTAVTVVVAEPYTVPDISGMTADEAAAALEEAGYTSHVEHVYDESVADGTVLGTTPAAGEKLASGSDVAINVSMSRATELVAATQALFAPGASVVIDGVNYDVVSCDSVTYQGSDTTAYSITAAPYTTFLGVKLPLEARAVTGTLVWSADNAVIGGSPSVAVG